MLREDRRCDQCGKTYNAPKRVSDRFCSNARTVEMATLSMRRAIDVERTMRNGCGNHADFVNRHIHRRRNLLSAATMFSTDLPPGDV